MTRPLFPMEGFSIGDRVLVGNIQGVITKFSVDNKRALVKFHNQYGEYENWVDVGELTALHQDTPADAPSPIVEGEAIPPDARGGDPGDPADRPYAGEGILELRGMIAKLQAELLMLQEQVNDHEDYIDEQVAASFDEAVIENEKLLTKTEIVVMPANAWAVDIYGVDADWDTVLDNASNHAQRIPTGWEFVSSQVTAVTIGDRIFFTEHITMKRETLVIDAAWDGGKTDGVQVVSEDTQRIPVELLTADDQ